MSEVVVSRWTRYGHDRLYVTTGSVRLGYWDNTTSSFHPESAELESALRAALDAHRTPDGDSTPNPTGGSRRLDSTRTVDPPAARTEAESTAAGAEEAPLCVADVPIPSPERPWTDLALNTPGAAARDRAVAAREAAPVKTRLAQVLRVHTHERAWRIGADGEEAVAARLARLPDAWRILHAVPVGTRGSDIDHVVIGPGGVYTINAKHHPHASVWVGGNTFMVNGHKQPYIRNSRYEAARASKVLSALARYPVFVTGLIAVIGAHSGFTIKNQPPGGEVHVVQRKKVADWLVQRGPVLGPEQVDGLFELARRSTTWKG